LAHLALPHPQADTQAKPNMPIVGWQNFNFFCAVVEKLKHEAVGCCVGKRCTRWSVFVTVFVTVFLMSNGQV
jgi:hypothetical protein